MELVSDGFVQQGRRHSRVHPAAQRTQHVTLADLSSESLHFRVCEVLHIPRRHRTADLEDEVANQLGALVCVRHLWVELQSEHLFLEVRHAGILTAGRHCYRLETWCKLCDFVSVRHPDASGVVHQPLEQPVHVGRHRRRVVMHLVRVWLAVPRGSRDAVDCRGVVGLIVELSLFGVEFLHHELRMAVLALGRRRHLALQRIRHLLQSIADAEERHVCLVDVLPEGRHAVGRLLLIHRVWPARQNDTFGAKVAYVVDVSVASHEFGIDADLAAPPDDEVAVLAAEVQNEDAVDVHLLCYRHPS
mmetsp:Transcript_22059/g.54168  ORF Transcript_22059/g.54168 Transcript_22059/m.54168 type:complete len:303 (-) Transcript_22059:214-1122(-)